MIAEHRASFKLELAEPPRATKTLLEADAPAWKRDMQLSPFFARSTEVPTLNVTAARSAPTRIPGYSTASLVLQDRAC